MKIGDIVVCNVTHKRDAPSVECFVEEVLFTPDWKIKQHGQQVSLYAVDGEYIGDYFENELQHTNRQIDDDQLKQLIRDAVQKDKWGLVLDFAKVWLNMKGDNR